MKISSISNVIFTGKIIDAHVGTFVDGFRHTVDRFTAQDIVEISNRPIIAASLVIGVLSGICYAVKKYSNKNV